MNAVTIKNLSKTYADGTEALKDVSLSIAQGDFFALLGANGAGKTTMIGIMTSLVNKTSGKVHVYEHDIDTDFAKAKRCIGVVPQEFNFNMFEKCQDIIVTQAGYFGIDRKRVIERSEFLLKKLGIWHKRNVPARGLSGGMKRRLMIARALIHEPKLLILDEPTAGVDVELRFGMWEYLKELNKQGVTILLTTHYLEEVEQLCRRAAIIKNGEIIKNDEVNNLVRMIDKETYSVTVKNIQGLDSLQHFNPLVIDDHTFEVELSKNDAMHDFVLKATEADLKIIDFRPKGHRLEKLFLNILQDK